ncbi:MlaE family ABC transporter permease [Aestuariivirga litoralis]|uniref:MlaE family ABC transporter permease n=1 Tax=Aestuariivirga litoralis TaxID=2650924 RepID=UPI0018C6ECA0|nr:ABC transporter permease [Aestuariivirga litoralis]MBG1231110.1 ABC transporter permease [Aestuariivirga litoralis]
MRIESLNIFAAVGRLVLTFCAELGRIVLFTKDAVLVGLTPRYFGGQILLQLFRVGYTSLPVVAMTAFFTGGALALQIYTGSSPTTAATLVPSIVAIGITRELGPVLAGLMVSGRVGASIAAELGTMKVTEQTDALVTLSTNPIKYLVGPRILAAVISLPLLVAIGDTIGVLGGYAVGTRVLGFNGASYIKVTANQLHFDDVGSGLIKAAVFGFIIALMGCYHGFNSKGGAQGVGRATTNAVVSSAILILAANFALTSILFGKN